jgi:hypothetical protein
MQSLNPRLHRLQLSDPFLHFPPRFEGNDQPFWHRHLLARPRIACESVKRKPDLSVRLGPDNLSGPAGLLSSSPWRAQGKEDGPGNAGPASEAGSGGAAPVTFVAMAALLADPFGKQKLAIERSPFLSNLNSDENPVKLT